MSATTLARVELRKMVDTRAGFWLQVATVAITVVAATVWGVVGGAADHTFAGILDVVIRPAAILLPVAGVLLVTSEWSQRTGMITFTLVPARSRVLAAKLTAGLGLTLGMLAMSVAVASVGVVVASPDVPGAWADFVPLIAQSALFLGAGTVTGIAFGAAILASAPAIVALFAVPIAWSALATLSFLADAAPWLDTRLAFDPLPHEVLGATGWAHVGTAVAIWVVLPLVVGTWRLMRRDIAS